MKQTLRNNSKEYIKLKIQKIIKSTQDVYSTIKYRK